MKLNLFFRILLSLTVASVMLVTVSCSSKNKVVTKVKEETAVKENVSSVIDSTFTIKENTIEEKKENKTKEKDSVITETIIEYVPIKDSTGNLIPFKYEEEVNGKVYKVSISGAGKVNTKKHASTNKEEDYNIVVTTYKRDYIAQLELNKKLNKDINTYKNIVNKDKEVKADYIKYMIWLFILIVFLTAIIIGGYFYFKNKLKILQV